MNRLIIFLIQALILYVELPEENDLKGVGIAQVEPPVAPINKLKTGKGLFKGRNRTHSNKMREYGRKQIKEEAKKRGKDATNLHECKESETESSECLCPPEYYCRDICGEDYSISTIISWQHFPRSTSSRSFCDDSEQDSKTFSQTTASTEKEEESESTKVSSVKDPITKSQSQLDSLHYLEIRHVSHLLNFLMGHLVCNEPHDPVQFLVLLLNKCLKYRDSFGEPPLLFTTSHVKSLYNAFDPFERGYLTLEQYHEAMRTLGLSNGITPYNKEPQLDDEGNVDEKYFLFEAERCLAENLREMLRVPKIAEENRLLWEKKMDRKKAKLRKKENETRERSENSEEKGYDAYCECSNTKNRREPEQLFLN